MLDWFVKAFLKASLAWLVIGITFGVIMAIHPPWIVYRPAHAHMLVLGFVAMMIFGVAYHVIPRFTSNPLHSRRAPVVHWWISNGGLALLVTGFIARAEGMPVASWFLAAGAALASGGAYTFAYVIWRTIDGSRERQDASRRAATLMAAGGNAMGKPRLPLA